MKREYKYEVHLSSETDKVGVSVYETKDDRPVEEMISVIKNGLKHIFEDETLHIEIFILTESTKFPK